MPTRQRSCRPPDGGSPPRASRRSVAPGSRRARRSPLRRLRWRAATSTTAAAGTGPRAATAAPSARRLPQNAVSLAPQSRAPYLHLVDVKLLKQASIFEYLGDGELARVAGVCREQ